MYKERYELLSRFSEGTELVDGVDGILDASHTLYGINEEKAAISLLDIAEDLIRGYYQYIINYGEIDEVESLDDILFKELMGLEKGCYL